jgi:hypothetical protein
MQESVFYQVPVPVKVAVILAGLLPIPARRDHRHPAFGFDRGH